MSTRQWTGRRIKRNHSSTLPRYIIAFGTETQRSPSDTSGLSHSHTLRLGAAKSTRLSGGKLVGTKSHRFTTSRDCWDWIYSRTAANYTTWLVGHNVLFDLVVSDFAGELTQARMALSKPKASRRTGGNADGDSRGGSICVIESPPTIIGLHVASTGGRIIVVDIMNWFRCPLEQLGLDCGLPKSEMPDWNASDADWFSHCERDVDIVLSTFVGLMQWASENDVGVFKYTSAGQSMAAFRHRFMEREIYVHDSQEAKELERKAYYGGRTEVFKLGNIDETVWQLDINSLFPWSMATGKVPYRLVRYENNAKWWPSRPPVQFSSSVCEVQIDGSDGSVPVRRNGYVIYPTGSFATTLCGEELRDAAERGLIVAFRNWATYDCDVLFEPFVRHFYSLRQHYKQSGQSLYDAFAKSVLNSLYGKFAQLAPRWMDQPSRMDSEPWSSWVEIDKSTGELCECRSFGYSIQRRMADEPHPNSFTAISAFVTANARCRMNRLRAIAGRRNVYYQGVDGLIVNMEGYNKLMAACEVDDFALGKLRHILQTNYGRISGIGDYRIGSKVAIGGLSGRRIASHDGSYMSQSFAAKSNLFVSGKQNSVLEIERRWQRSNRYCRNRVDEAGWVSPIHVDDDCASACDSDSGIAAACSANRSTTDPYSASLLPE